MRKSRFTESQIVAILKQGEAGMPIAEILRQHSISKATYFQWRPSLSRTVTAFCRHRAIQARCASQSTQ